MSAKTPITDWCNTGDRKHETSSMFPGAGRIHKLTVLTDSALYPLLRASESVVLNLAEGARLRAESAVVRAGTFLELCTRTDKHNPEPKACAMALLDRIASTLRGLGSG